MYEVCLAKFTQNEDLKRKLIGTGDSILIELGMILIGEFAMEKERMPLARYS